jgi:hypothetical protein
MTQLEPDLPGDYAAALTTLKSLVREAQQRAQRVVNTAMIELYWNIGYSGVNLRRVVRTRTPFRRIPRSRYFRCPPTEANPS